MCLKLIGPREAARMTFSPTILPRVPCSATLSERLAPVEHEKVDNGHVVLVSARAVSLHRLLSMAREMISIVECEYRRYRALVSGDDGLPADVLANAIDNLDDISGKEVLSEGDGRSTLTVDYRSGITRALARLSRTIPISGSEFVDLERHLVDEVEIYRAATVKEERMLRGKRNWFTSLRSRPIMLLMISLVCVDGSRLLLRVE